VHRWTSPVSAALSACPESPLWGIAPCAATRQDRHVTPSRLLLLATLVAVMMCIAGMAQLFGVSRASTDDAPPATRPAAPIGVVDLQFKSDYLPLDN
jgi:hypothetical protein